VYREPIFHHLLLQTEKFMLLPGMDSDGIEAGDKLNILTKNDLGERSQLTPALLAIKST